MSTKKLQILGQLGDKIYKQNEAPIDAPNGTLWVDLDASDGSTNDSSTNAWRKVAEIKLEKDLTYISVTEDMDGNPLSYDEAVVVIGATRPSSYARDVDYVVGPYNGYVESFANYGFHSFAITTNVRVSVIKFTLLGSDLIEAHITPQMQVASSLSQYTDFASRIMPISWKQSYEGGFHTIIPAKDINENVVCLNKDKKMCGITIGSSVTSWEIGKGSTVEVWVR